MPERMIFASALVTERELAQSAPDYDPRDAAVASRLLCEQSAAQLDGATPDFAIVFISSHFTADAYAISKNVRAQLRPRVLIGCTAEGVIGSTEEVEGQPAIALLAAHLPGVQTVPFALEGRSLSEWSTMMSSAEMFHEIIGSPLDPRLFIVLADPFSAPLNGLPNSGGLGILDAFNTYFPGVPLAGGVASGAQYPGANALLLDGHVMHGGAVGVALCGPIDVNVIVSQGCRPVGKPFRVTRAKQNLILGLDDKPPVEQLQATIDTLDETDQRLLARGLYVGRAVRSLPASEDESFGRGDFLVRGVIGGDNNTGALAIGDMVDKGDIVQFHVRDVETAIEDFDMLLAPHTLYDPPAGGLLFSCNGRGRHLFNYPNGDVNIIQSALADEARQQPVQLAGFFCGGEIGPLGKQAFLHGHTASLVLFRPAA